MDYNEEQKILNAVENNDVDYLKTLHDSTIFEMRHVIRSKYVGKDSKAELYCENVIDLRRSTL